MHWDLWKLNDKIISWFSPFCIRLISAWRLLHKSFKEALKALLHLSNLRDARTSVALYEFCAYSKAQFCVFGSQNKNRDYVAACTVSIDRRASSYLRCCRWWCTKEWPSLEYCFPLLFRVRTELFAWFTGYQGFVWKHGEGHFFNGANYNFILPTVSDICIAWRSPRIGRWSTCQRAAGADPRFKRHDVYQTAHCWRGERVHKAYPEWHVFVWHHTSFTGRRLIYSQAATVLRRMRTKKGKQKGRCQGTEPDISPFGSTVLGNGVVLTNKITTGISQYTFIQSEFNVLQNF